MAGSSLALSLAEPLLARYGPWPCFVIALCVYIAAVGSLAHLPSDPKREMDNDLDARDVDSEAVLTSSAWWAKVFLALTTLVFNPLSNAIMAPYVEQYISKRFSVPISTASGVGGFAGWCGLSVVLLLPPTDFILRRWVASTESRNFMLASFCLLAECGASLAMVMVTTLSGFKYALGMASIGPRYILFSKSLITTGTAESQYFTVLASYELPQTLMRFFTGMGLENLFRLETEWHFTGLVYVAVAACALLGLFFLIVAKLILSRLEDEARTRD